MFAKIVSFVSVVSVLSLLGFSSCGVAAEEQPGEVKQKIPTIQGRTRRPEKIEKAQEKSERRARKQAEAAARVSRFFYPHKKDETLLSGKTDPDAQGGNGSPE